MLAAGCVWTAVDASCRFSQSRAGGSAARFASTVHWTISVGRCCDRGILSICYARIVFQRYCTLRGYKFFFVFGSAPGRLPVVVSGYCIGPQFRPGFVHRLGRRRCATVLPGPFAASGLGFSVFCRWSVLFCRQRPLAVESTFFRLRILLSLMVRRLRAAVLSFFRLRILPSAVLRRPLAVEPTLFRFLLPSVVLQHPLMVEFVLRLTLLSMVLRHPLAVDLRRPLPLQIVLVVRATSATLPLPRPLLTSSFLISHCLSWPCCISSRTWNFGDTSAAC